MELFIGRVPPAVGVDTLTSLFAPYGANNVRMLDGKFCAFANFGSPADAERAMADLNGYQLGTGPGLNVKPADAKATPRGVKPEPVAMASSKAFRSPAGNAREPNRDEAPQLQPEIFIGRLVTGTSLQEVEDRLVPYGATNIRLLEGKNCAFAAFETWAAAERAIAELHGSHLGKGGSPDGLNVKFADVKGAPGAPKDPKVFIGGISPEVSEADVSNACLQFGEVTQTKIFAKNPSQPCAFVTFTSFTEAEVCISNLNSTEHPLASPGKVLVVRLADISKGGKQTGQPITAFGAPTSFGRGLPPAPAPMAAFGGGLGKAFGGLATYGGGGNAGAHGGHDVQPGGGGQGPKVFIGGLPESANDDFLWGMMAPYGRVAETKMLKKPGALPCGFVRFSQAYEAEQAVAVLGDHGRFTVKFADDGRSGNKRPAASAFNEAGKNRRTR